jgi:hypothetical protein
MEFWALRLGEQFELTSRTTVTLTQAESGPPTDLIARHFDRLSVG